jgi:hypothetical protein
LVAPKSENGVDGVDGVVVDAVERGKEEEEFTISRASLILSDLCAQPRGISSMVELLYISVITTTKQLTSLA